MHHPGRPIATVRSSLQRQISWAVGVWIVLLTMQVSGLGCAEPEGSDTTMPLMVVVKGPKHLQQLRQMCMPPDADNASNGDLRHELPKDCYIAGGCKRVFANSIQGVSGDFTSSDVDIIKRCLVDGVKYFELDGLVSKPKGTHSKGNDTKPLPEFDGMNFGRGTSLRTLKGNDSEGESDQSRLRKVDEEMAKIVGAEAMKAQSLHPAFWHLDRIDQRNLPLNKEYRYGSTNIVGTGRGVTVYILDSGIRPNHQEFADWTSGKPRAHYGYDFVDDDSTPEDCEGHGTAVTSLAIGRAVGVAKEAQAVAVRVLDCNGKGGISTSVAGLDWVAKYHKKPGVVVLSLGVDMGNWSQTLEDAVKSLVYDHGLTVVVASGNDGIDSCSVAPANLPETITVAASDLDTKFGLTKIEDKEDIYSKSNTGPCIDIFAPGVDIFAACGGAEHCKDVTDEAYAWTFGTSMAAPQVAGVAAMYLGEFPDASPAEVKKAIVDWATVDKLDSPVMRSGTPNKLLYSHIFEASGVK